MCVYISKYHVVYGIYIYNFMFAKLILKGEQVYAFKVTVFFFFTKAFI
jgi:hypothetical protein